MVQVGYLEAIDSGRSEFIRKVTDLSSKRELVKYRVQCQCVTRFFLNDIPRR